MTTTGRSRLRTYLAALFDSKAGGPSRRDFSWILCGNITYSFCQWAFVVVLAKTGSPVDVGCYALALAIATPLLTFANCQGRNLVASDVTDQYTFGEYLGFRASSLALAVAAVVLIAGWTGHSRSAIAVTSLLGVSLAFDWMSETYFGLMQKYDRLDRIGLSLMLKGPLCLVLMSSAMLATGNLVWATVALMAGRGLVLTCFDARAGARLEGPLRLKWRRGTLQGMVRSSLPLGVISAISAFNVSIPRYFIEADVSTHDLGIYSAISSLVGAGSLVMSALANSSFVAIARAVARGDRRQYRVLSLRLLGTSAVLGICGVTVSLIAGQAILTRVFRAEYASSTGVFTRLMVAGALGYMISGQGYALTAARVLTPQIPILVCAAITTVLFCWWLVPIRGIEGAADAWVLSSAATLALSSVILARVRPGSNSPGAEVQTGQAAPAGQPELASSR
jgi:O-antigen/teichoic acid export membrane protein